MLGLVKKLMSKDTLTRLLLNLCDQALASGTNFLIGVLVARFAADKATYGLYATGLVIVGIYYTLQDGVIMSPFMWAFHKEEDRRPTVHGSGLLQLVMMSVLLTTCMLIIAGCIPAHYLPEGFKDIALPLAVSLPLMMMKEQLRKMSFTGLDPAKALVIDVIYSVLAIGSVVLLGTHGLLTAAHAYLTMATASTVAMVIWLWKYRHLFRFSPDHAIRNFRTYWPQTRWFVLVALAWTLGANSYPMFVSWFWGNEEVAILAASNTLVFCLQPLIAGIGNTFTTQLTLRYQQGGIQRVRISYVKLMVLTFGLVLVPGLGAIVFGEQVLRLVYGARYAGHGNVIATLGLMVMVWSLGITNNRLFVSLQRLDIDSKINLGMLLYLPIGIWMTAEWGAIGAAHAMLGSQIISALVQLYVIIFRLRVFPARAILGWSRRLLQPR